MKITIESSRLVKPNYNGNIAPSNHQVRLSVFDNVTDNAHMAVVYVFNPPTPSNIIIEKGLSKALSKYREWAGRLGEDEEDNLVILLNDQGVRFVEATISTELRNVLPSKPTKEIQSLHLSLYNVEELMQVQLTRFACGSLVVGFTAHHQIADGHATGNFLVAWGLATRDLAFDPFPLLTRDSLFKPRDPPLIQYDHHNIEYISNKNIYTKTMSATGNDDTDEKEIVIQKVHFTSEFITKLRTKASAGVSKPYSRFATVLGHLWRVITKARDLQVDEITKICIAVDGRSRMDPKVPNEYFGNLILWAFPRSKVSDLINRPLNYAVELIHVEVTKINNSYFRSFIDFASSGIVSEEELVSTAAIYKRSLSPDLEANSWLTIPFCDFNFGSGSPYYFMPSYFPMEGLLFLLPSNYLGDGSIEAIVQLFRDNIDNFKRHCYSLD